MDRSQAYPLTDPIAALRLNLLAIVHAALRAADAGALVAAALHRRDAGDRAIWLIAAGKAAPVMAARACRELGSHVRGGLVIGSTRFEAPAPLEGVTAQHPEPGEGSEDGGRRALALAERAQPDEELLVLLSGGASALMAVPSDGITLEDKRRTTAILLKAGADIHGLNTVRKHLSAIKGGRLAARTAATCRTLALSDVVGDDLSVIASGPTVADRSTFADALDVLTRYAGLESYPRAVVDRLMRGAAGDEAETPKPGDLGLARSRAEIVGSRHDAMRGASEAASALGFHVHVVEQAIVGEARVAAGRHLDEIAHRLGTLTRPLCVVSSGETTVTVRGTGRGGRNQEFALASSERLPAIPCNAVLASFGTDGIDGPTDAAGALVDSSTTARAAEAGLDPESFLTDNNSYEFFQKTGDLIRTGPTDTNVGDVQVLLLA